jgi:hypothetical protein
MSGIFGDLGVDGTEVELPSSGGYKPGTYLAQISNAEIKVGTKKDDTAVNIILHYTLDDFPDSYAVQEYFGLPKTAAPWDNLTVIRETPQGQPVTEDSHNKWLLGILKKRLLSLGVPEEKVNDVKTENLIGIPVVIKLVKNGEYTNIARNDGVMLRPEMTAALPTPAPANAAKGFSPAWG